MFTGSSNVASKVIALAQFTSKKAAFLDYFKGWLLFLLPDGNE
jgi:hypothetical protein